MSERNLYEVTGDIKDINTLLVPREQLEAIVGEQEPVAWCPALTYPGHEKDRAWANGKPRKEDIEYWKLNGKGITYAYAAPVAQQYEAGDMASAHNDGFRAGVASVAQQQAEIEVQCPVCNHKFYEWPNDQQPQAEHHKCCANCAEHGECRPNNIRGCGYDPDDACNKQPQAEATHQYDLAHRLRVHLANRHTLTGPEFKNGVETILAEYYAAPQQAEAVPSDVVRDVEAAAKKMAEIFDYPWDFMPEKGRNTMRENVRAVLTAAQGVNHG